MRSSIGSQAPSAPATESHLPTSSPTMFMAAAKALAALSPARNDPANNLLPPVTALREVSIAVARATALQARKEGLTDLAEDEIDAAIHAKMWSPKYLPYRRTRARR